jgi:GrpB-like predicted nucleotidyltransferase (UPF0157 family)
LTREKAADEEANRFGLGLEQEVNRLVAYNPSWPLAFLKEARRIKVALGERALAIEHYGSTAVPGLRAKPIIDLLIGVVDMSYGVQFIEPMSNIGYEYAGSQGIPDHCVFGKGRARTHLAHVAIYQGELWNRCLIFRDRLRSNPEVRHAYEALKRRLASDPTNTRGAYTAGKTAFIRDVVEDRWQITEASRDVG